MSVASARGGANPFPFIPIRRPDADPNAAPGSILSAPVTPGRRLPVVDKTHVDPQTLAAAQGMEAMFLDYMLKVMRETVPKQDMDLESPATAIYRGMQDSEYAQRAAHAGGVGLADQIVAYLEAQRYTLPREQGVPARAQAANAVNGKTGTSRDGQDNNIKPSVTGGSHAGR